MNLNRLRIQRLIAEIENIYPDDQLIHTYQDFLKHRNFINYYQFNPLVFDALVSIAHRIWNTKKRINRPSLIFVIKRYYSNANKAQGLKKEILAKLFELFERIVLYDNYNLKKETVDELKKQVNSMFINQKLTEGQIRWLCENAERSHHILNRVLRYPGKSKIISRWANDNYYNNRFRNRRAEITSWIIDENKSFELSKETMIADFEYLNKITAQRIKDYENEYEAHYAVESQLLDVVMPKAASGVYKGGFKFKEKLLSSPPEFEDTRRFYVVPAEWDREHAYEKPDLKKLEADFYNKFEYLHTQSRIWSIAYSRISVQNKIRLLYKYYSHEFYPSFLNVGKRLKSIEYYQWLETMV